MATPLLRRQILLLHHRLRLHNYQRLTVTAPHRLWCSATTPTTSPSSSEHAKERASSDVSSNSSDILLKAKPPLREEDELDYRRWKNEEEEILRDIEPIVLLTKDIIHSGRYKDGVRLSVEDEKAVVEKLLAYHPQSEDKIGCGLESIMVNRHPRYRYSRCLFVVRTDGGWIDFSYQKCLWEYIRGKYPTHAERFIRKHFKGRKCLREYIRDKYPTLTF